MNQKKKAIGYIRRSSHKQTDNDSFIIQKKQILYRAEKEGYEIVLWCEDEAVSAYKTVASKRKGLNKAKDLLLADGAEAFFFYEESRIDRSIESFFKDIYTPLKESKPDCKFFSTKSEIEWDPMDHMVIIKFILAGHESYTKSVRTIDIQKSSLSHKLRPGGRPPFGYDVYDKKLYPNEHAQIVRFIFFLSSWGYSSEKIPTSKRSCHPFTSR